MQARYLEDLTVGDSFALGDTLMAEDEMIAYARRYDPQPFHLDPVAARDTAAGGLIASGWLTTSKVMRLLCDAAPFGATPILGVGVEELRWPAPIRPGDVLTGTAEIIETRPSRSRADRGTVRMRIVLHNQRGEVVFSMIPTVIVPAGKKQGEGSALDPARAMPLPPLAK